MKPTSLFLAGFFAASLAAQTTPPAYDPQPQLKASEILQLPYLASPLHKVREEVSTSLGVNRYVIDSQFGVFVAEGNQMLHDRVLEIRALARLREMSSSKEYQKGLVEAAKVPLDVVEKLASDPVDTIAAVPKGVGKFLGRVGRGAKEAASGRDRGAGEDGALKSLAGVSSTKRKICAELGINPYSSNEVLQHELDRVAWVIFAGKITVSAATMPIGGAAGAALTGISAVDMTNDIVCSQSPVDLRSMNRGKLEQLRIASKDAEAFLANPSFTPSHQTQIVGSLGKLAGVSGLDVLLRDATAMSENETDAVFYEQTARLIAHLHAHGFTVDRIMLLSGFPVCIGKDGGVIVALQWDHAMWTPRSEAFAAALQGLTVNGVKPPSLIVAVTGTATASLRRELEARGFRVHDKLLKGPLN